MSSTHAFCRLIKKLLSGMGVGLLGAMLALTPASLVLEKEFGLSWLFKIRGPVEATDKVIVVSIDRASAEFLGIEADAEKWPRGLHAQLIERLNTLGVSLIAFNIVFDEARDPADDNAMAAAMTTRNNVVLSDYLKRHTLVLKDSNGWISSSLYRDTLVSPIPVLMDAALCSAPFPLPRSAVNVSQFWTFKTSAGEMPTLPTTLFSLYVFKQVYKEVRTILQTLDGQRFADLPAAFSDLRSPYNAHQLLNDIRSFITSDPAAETSWRAIQNPTTPIKTPAMLSAWLNLIDHDNSHYLNHYGPSGSITTIPYHMVLQGRLTNRELFRDSVVFVGFSEDLQPERHPGFYTVYSRASGSSISSVELAATAFANLLENSMLFSPGPETAFWLLLAWGCLLGLLVQPVGPGFSALLIFGLGSTYLYLAAFLFKTENLWLPLIIPLCIQAPTLFFFTWYMRYRSSKRDRDALEKGAKAYLPQDVVESLLDPRLRELSDKGSLVYGVCMASDVEQFTRLSESLPPMELGDLLEAYYGLVLQRIRSGGAAAWDVAGDGFMAIWAAPTPDQEIRAKACHAALGIALAVEQFNQHSSKVMPTRIGLHSGVIRLGNLGLQNEKAYRAVGDAVNTASRIEGLNKILGTRILVSDSVIEALPGFCTRPLGAFLLKGKTHPVSVNELLCLQERATPIHEDLCGRFQEALAAFRAGKLERADIIFSRLLNDYPDDGPSQFYRQFGREHGVEEILAKKYLTIGGES